MKISVYGTGCKTCKLLHQRVLLVVKENNLNAEVFYETDVMNIAKRGILQTPALEVNNKIVHTGKVPKIKDLYNLIINNL
ncbi:MAG: thioredoxin family protein [Acholeplasmataceae bacterium]|nr:thioredoxin family protein [Acholeplasmataceae bacterium]